MNKNVLRKLSYGVYIVSTLDGERPTGCVANSIMQVTQDTVAISINHENFTNECIKKSGKIAISILGTGIEQNTIPIFGFQSGRERNKFDNIESIDIDGLKVIKSAAGYIICELVNSVETETHTVFICKITNGDVLNEQIPMTYAYYHQVIKGNSPNTAPTSIAE